MREGYDQGNSQAAGSFESPQEAAGQELTDSPAWATAGVSQQHTEVGHQVPGRVHPECAMLRQWGMQLRILARQVDIRDPEI